MKPIVYMTRKVQKEGIDLLQGSCDLRIWQEDCPVPRDVLLENVREAQGLYVTVLDTVDNNLLEHAPNLKVVSTYAVGYNNIDVAACTARGIPLGNTPGILTETTADMAFGLMLAAGRRIVEAAKYVHERRWDSWKPDLMLGQDVHHATLGIIGFGAIGQALARRAQGFNMQVIFYDPRKDHDPLPEISQFVDLEDLLTRSDFVSLHVPLTDSTRFLIGEPELEKMKPTAVLVNTSRGEIVDPQALYQALKHGKIYAAALDVTYPEPIAADDPLHELPNCIIVPHIASASHITRTNMAVLAARNLLAGLAGEPMPHCVNPQVYSTPG